MGKNVLIVDDVSMRFNLNSEKVDDFQEALTRFLLRNRARKEDEFWSLKNVSFQVEQGDRVGILGLNGAGKSTLLKVVAGVYKPTTGHVTKHGRVVPMLELGAGFDPQYTGRENIFLYGTVLGYPRKYLEEKYDEIVEFSELGRFIDVPIKNYSSGMKSKLGFSIASIANPDILILDEVLSVGDAKFRKKSEAKMMSLIEGGTTVLFVSHSLAQVKRICNKAMILDHGELVAYGDIEEVAEKYQALISTDEDVLEKRKRRLKRLKRQAKELREYINYAEGQDKPDDESEEDAPKPKKKKPKTNSNTNKNEGE